MIIRLLVLLGLTAFGIGFVWFAAQVVYLGIREFFKIHSVNGSESKTNKNTKNEKEN